MTQQAMLHLMCGKIAAGKSTLAAQLADQPQTILIAEDHWLDALFADQMTTISDYVKYAGKLRPLIAGHVAKLLQAGVSVVLDFPANTPDQRAWLRDIAQNAGVGHVLHVLDMPDDLCLARLRARNASGQHPFAVTDAQFAQISQHFTLPRPEEGLETKYYRP